VIVSVETNFILELALQQQEADQADAILQLAEAKRIQLVIPAISFAEAYSKLIALSKKRNRLHQDLRTEIKQMARSQPYAELEQTSKSIADALVSCTTVHASQLSKTADRLRACAQVIPLTAKVIFEMSFLEPIFELESGDAFVYASIHEYLKEVGRPRSLFVTKDKDFQQTAEYLAAVGGDLILGFGAALAKIK